MNRIKHCIFSIEEDRILSYRIAGDGPPLLLLHASPLNSASLIPLMMQLHEDYTVIAIDTPGYGYSSPLPIKPNSLSEYTRVLIQFLEALDISSTSIYGSATGAQIAIRFALEYADKVNNLFLDNVAHFTDDARNEIIRDYFPDLSPKKSGIQLIKAFHISRSLFEYFPWCDRSPTKKLNGPPIPIKIIHSICLEYIRSGKQYDLAYRLAFEHEKREHIAKLSVPTTIFRWSESIVKPFTDEIFKIPLPENVNEELIAQGENRIEKMSDLIKSKNQEMQHSPIKTTIEFTPMSIPLELLGPFPEIEESGRYWIEAWDKIQNSLDDKSLEEKTDLLYHWAKSEL